MEEKIMKPLFRMKGALGAAMSGLALLSGCGSSQTAPVANPNNAFGTTPGVPGSAGCYRADQPIPFTVNNAYLSAIQMCTPGTSISCPSPSGNVQLGGSGATQGYFTDVDVSGSQSVRMDIIPYSTTWQPNGIGIAPMTGNGRGTFQIGPVMLQYLQSRNGGAMPCVSRIIGFTTGFDPYPGSAAGRTTLFSTRIVIQWQGSMSSGQDELAM